MLPEIKSFYKKNLSLFSLLTENSFKKLFIFDEMPVYFYISGIGPELDLSFLESNIVNFNSEKVFLINIGFCGILNENRFKIGDIIIPQNIYKENGIDFIENSFIPLSELHYKKSRSLITVNREMNDITEKEKYSYYDIVDMEAYSIVSWSKEKGKNFYIVKIASDYANENAKKKMRQNISLLHNSSEKLLNDILKNIGRLK